MQGENDLTMSEVVGETMLHYDKLLNLLYKNKKIGPLSIHKSYLLLKKFCPINK